MQLYVNVMYTYNVLTVYKKSPSRYPATSKYECTRKYACIRGAVKSGRKITDRARRDTRNYGIQKRRN